MSSIKYMVDFNASSKKKFYIDKNIVNLKFCMKNSKTGDFNKWDILITTLGMDKEILNEILQNRMFTLRIIKKYSPEKMGVYLLKYCFLKNYKEIYSVKDGELRYQFYFEKTYEYSEIRMLDLKEMLSIKNEYRDSKEKTENYDLAYMNKLITRNIHNNFLETKRKLHAIVYKEKDKIILNDIINYRISISKNGEQIIIKAVLNKNTPDIITELKYQNIINKDIKISIAIGYIYLKNATVYNYIEEYNEDTKENYYIISIANIKE